MVKGLYFLIIYFNKVKFMYKLIKWPKIDKNIISAFSKVILSTVTHRGHKLYIQK